MEGAGAWRGQEGARIDPPAHPAPTHQFSSYLARRLIQDMVQRLQVGYPALKVSAGKDRRPKTPGLVGGRCPMWAQVVVEHRRIRRIDRRHADVIDHLARL